MFDFTKEEREILQEDSKSHPACSYSVSARKKCSDKNGAFICETLRQLQRVCPQKNAVTIYSQAKQSDAHDEADDIFESFQRFGNERGRFFDPFVLFEESLKNFGSEFFDGHDIPLQRPPSHQQKPQVGILKPPGSPNKFQGTLMNDSVEEI